MITKKGYHEKLDCFKYANSERMDNLSNGSDYVLKRWHIDYKVMRENTLRHGHQWKII